MDIIQLKMMSMSICDVLISFLSGQCGLLTLAALSWQHDIKIAPEQDRCLFFLSSQNL